MWKYDNKLFAKLVTDSESWRMLQWNEAIEETLKFKYKCNIYSDKEVRDAFREKRD